MFSGIGPTELLIVLGIVLIIFGPKRLPGLGKQLGGSMREFKDAIGGRERGDDVEAALGRPEGEPAAEPVLRDGAAR